MGESWPGRIGADGSAQSPCGSRDRCPADSVSQPSVGHVFTRVVRTLRPAPAPCAVRPHSAGVFSRVTSLHISPGTPMITTRPVGAEPASAWAAAARSHRSGR
ncbi:hypothetical protein [Actinomadura madurae]|uniref:hypothetical protein n=1 Tax=Actinomadura madurae TaxID=1993 RepID=UPI0020D21798|nr:hypothetical protein [Actinomadura madurae]MCQ0007216.1 hypothetical protein [Actinomadura madurae]MCQ0017479.1 hypothetical protein [Actinomadura madurae]